MAKFTGTFVLTLHAGLWNKITKTVKMVFGRSDCEDDPIAFDPSLGPQGEITGINHLSLGDYADNDKLASLAPIHIPSQILMGVPPRICSEYIKSKID